MIACEDCGAANAEGVEICQNCGSPLLAAPEQHDAGQDMPRPRLLAQIQGLIPPEPAISSGRLSEPDARWDALRSAEEAWTATQPEPDPQPEAAGAAGAVVQAATSAGAATGSPTSPPAAPGQTPGYIALFLLVAILASWLLPPAPDMGAPRRPAVETAYTFIEILPRNARVLLAWDYEPTTQGEMQLLARPLLLHLHSKGARLANVSLRPTGPAVAADAYEAAFGSLVAAGLAVPEPVEFGFVPGAAMALRSLAVAPADTVQLPLFAAQALDLAPGDSLDSFDLIIELSAETAASREWVEQIAVRVDAPLIVAASGAAAPALRPYEQTGQIAALLNGYADALAYEDLLAHPGPARAQRMPQSLAHLALILLIVVALVRSSLNPALLAGRDGMS